MENEVQRYSRATRVLHWIHTGAFLVLFLTGLVLFVPGLAFLAEDGWTRVLHRIAAVIFIVAPLIYLPMNWKASLRGLKDAFTWGKEDIGWVKAAPRYYFFNNEECMPPQGHMNVGQKLWWFMVVISWAGFVVTGIIMWFFAAALSGTFMLWIIVVHDIAFIATGCMLLVHIYLSAIHPLMRPWSTGAWSSMARGTVSAEYCKSHHAKWYEELREAEKTGSPK